MKAAFKTRRSVLKALVGAFAGGLLAAWPVLATANTETCPKLGEVVSFSSDLPEDYRRQRPSEDGRQQDWTKQPGSYLITAQVLCLDTPKPMTPDYVAAWFFEEDNPPDKVEIASLQERPLFWGRSEGTTPKGSVSRAIIGVVDLGSMQLHLFVAGFDDWSPVEYEFKRFTSSILLEGSQ